MTQRWRLCLSVQNLLTRSYTSAPVGMSRNYVDAITSLNTLQTNFSIVNSIRKSGRKLNEVAITEMAEWASKIGYQPSDLSQLNAIHIAGTKGKGSTAAFISSILGQRLHQRDNRKDAQLQSKDIGLYTSPHLRFVRERIQVNGVPLDEKQFTQYFFETWDRLEDAAQKSGIDPKSREAKPVYFRFLTLMAFHAYISMDIKPAIIECGIGGRYDSTNILETPSVTGITSLGIDHVGVLGNTLREIAWHKAGIMKKGVKCFTPASQPSEAKEVMQEVADEVGAQLVFVDIDPEIQNGQTKLGLQADFQKINASLAVAIAKEYLISQGFVLDAETDKLVKNGLEQVHWPGRCETRQEPGISWYIDGGHTLESIELAGNWFASQQMGTVSKPTSQQTRFLIFNQQTRDATALAKKLHDTLSNAIEKEQPFTHAIFCTNTTFRQTGFRPELLNMNVDSADVQTLKVQRELAEAWSEIDPTTKVQVVLSIEEAIEIVRIEKSKQGDLNDISALVTGSLHLVGGFLDVLESGQD